MFNHLRDRLDTICSFGVKSLAFVGSVARDEASETSDLVTKQFSAGEAMPRLKPRISQIVLEEAIDVT